MSRRRFLAVAAGTVAAGAWALGRPLALAADRRGAVRALVHDAAHQGAAFSQGRVLGASLSAAGVLSGPGSFESAPVASPFAFTHVGLHYQSEPSDPDGVTFEVRTSADGTTWSPWHEVHVEARAAETSKGETFGTLVWAPKHRYAQYRASLPAPASLLSVTATFINTVDGPVIELPEGGGTPAGSGAPVTFSREDWGADEALRFRDGREIWPRAYVPVKKVVVHHTVTRNSHADEEDAKADVRAVYTYHARTLGWGDIGYNALVDQFGNTYEGRHGRDLSDGREILSEDVVAGHALAHNYGSVGIALLGTFCTAEECEASVAPSDAMIDSLRELVVWKCRTHQIDPLGTGDYLLSTDAWNRGLANISGHRDCNATICPGGRTYELLAQLREQVAELLANASAPTVALAASPPQGTVASGRAVYGWGPPDGAVGYAYSYYLEGWYRDPNSAIVTYLRGFTDDRRPRWSEWLSDTSAVFADLPDGHYTFHVRAKDSNGVVSVYQDNRTLLMVNRAPTTGDVNCDGSVDSVDGLLVLQSDAGLIDSVPCPQYGDVNGDGVINAVDASLILQYGAGLLQSFPASVR